MMSRLIIGCTIASDLATKAIFPTMRCPQCTSGPELLNADFGGGHLASGPAVVKLLIPVIVLVAFVVAATRLHLNPASVGLVVGGSLGNLTDRVIFGGVRDWMPFGPAIINLADLAVVLGVASALFFHYRRGGQHEEVRQVPAVHRGSRARVRDGSKGLPVRQTRAGLGESPLGRRVTKETP